METYFVSVEQRMYKTGTIEIEANSLNEAVEIARRMVDNEAPALSNIEWGEPQNEIDGLNVTEDVD
jgi:hypothetical protein